MRNSSFFSLEKTSRKLTTLIVLQIAITVSMMTIYSYYPRFLYWENVFDDDLANLGVIFFYVTTGVGITIWVIFYYWFYKSYKNLKLFYTRPLRHSPRVALVCLFVPIVNIWETYFNVREIWKYSDPNILPSGEPIKYKHEKNIVIVWWISLLSSSLLVFLFWSGNLIAALISDSLYLFGLVMWFLIIREITLRQAEKNKILSGNPLEFKD